MNNIFTVNDSHLLGPDENGKISNLWDPDAEKQIFGQKSQNWPNLGRKWHVYT
ncbi:hypothetical protein Hanom_Chr16g01487161 [Helianthus anomalus]